MVGRKKMEVTEGKKYEKQKKNKSEKMEETQSSVATIGSKGEDLGRETKIWTDGPRETENKSKNSYIGPNS